MTRVVELPSLARVLEFCAQDPVERVFLEDIARRGVGRFAAVAGEDGAVVALCHVGANIVPAGRGLDALVPTAARGRPRMIVGEERAVDELWAGLAEIVDAPAEDRPGQPVFVLESAPPPGGSGLRAAGIDDLDLLVDACAAAYREEVGIDAYSRDPELFRWRTRSQIELGRSWLWRDGGRILFKAEASAWTPSAVQLQQVWVEPELRGQGFARAGFADLCRSLLERVPRVCLFARPDNAPALALYDGAGMRRTMTYRSLIFP